MADELLGADELLVVLGALVVLDGLVVLGAGGLRGAFWTMLTVVATVPVVEVMPQIVTP